MFHRRLPLFGAAIACAFLLSAGLAKADVLTDVSWSLGETTTTYGSQFHISTNGDGSVQYRWLDNDMTKTTVISGNNCTDISLFGKSTFNGGDTSYHTLFSGFTSQCFLLRGRTENGTTITHSGRVRR